MGCLLFEKDVEAAGIRNLREVNNAERDVVRVRRWSIVPRRNSDTKPAGGKQRGALRSWGTTLEHRTQGKKILNRGRFFLMTAAYGL